MAVRRVVVLGATGSVGQQSLDVIAASPAAGTPNTLELVGVSAGKRWQELLRIAADHGVAHAVVGDADARRAAADAAGDSYTIHHHVGDMLDACEPDVVLNAVVGVAGLSATLAALERGIDVALANKESLVAAGALCMATARRTGASIIPVDSEHSALQQCIASSTAEEIESLVLTASGGPFFGSSSAQLQSVTVAEALNHPTWDMGGKITIDSATLMNKGLEMIEACVLFDMPATRVETVIHRHSIVHALVRHRDGSLLAHLGWPDMRVPIAWALHWPARPHVPQVRELDLVAMPALEFYAPDLSAFPCLALARSAAQAGAGAPCVLNAANEVAVAAFVSGEIAFLGIPGVVEAALDRVGAPGEPASLEEVRELDAVARNAAAHALHAVG